MNILHHCSETVSSVSAESLEKQPSLPLPSLTVALFIVIRSYTGSFIKTGDVELFHVGLVQTSVSSQHTVKL